MDRGYKEIVYQTINLIQEAAAYPIYAKPANSR